MKLFGTFLIAYLSSNLYLSKSGLQSPDHSSHLLVSLGVLIYPAGTLDENNSSPNVAISKTHHSPSRISSTENLGQPELNSPCGNATEQVTDTSSTSQSAVFQVWVNAQVVAELPVQADAEAIATRFEQLLQDPDFHPDGLKPALINETPAGVFGETILFTIHDSWAKQVGNNAELVAIAWINDLRTALDTDPLTLADAQASMYRLTQTRKRLEGIASWYGPYFHGRLTATGERFDQHALTAAHPFLPFGTYLKVTNLESGHSVVVRINDRGPYVGIRSLDLSREAARCLNSEEAGVVPYEAVIMQPNPAATPTYYFIETHPDQLANR